MIVLTPTMIKGIVYAVEDTTLPMYQIAEYSGITYRTLRNWLRYGEDTQQQIEDGKIMKDDLSKKQQLQLELYLRVREARIKRENARSNN